MNTRFFHTVALILLTITLSPINSSAHGLSLPTQWELDKFNVYNNESNFVKIPARAGDVIGGISGGAIGIALGIPVGAITTLFSGQAVCLLIVPVMGNTVVGAGGRFVGSALIGTPFYLIEKPFKLVAHGFTGNKNTQ
jgi:hypothetical protein